MAPAACTQRQAGHVGTRCGATTFQVGDYVQNKLKPDRGIGVVVGEAVSGIWYVRYNAQDPCVLIDGRNLLCSTRNGLPSR